MRNLNDPLVVTITALSAVEYPEPHTLGIFLATTLEHVGLLGALVVELTSPPTIVGAGGPTDRLLLTDPGLLEVFLQEGRRKRLPFYASMPPGSDYGLIAVRTPPVKRHYLVGIYAASKDSDGDAFGRLYFRFQTLAKNTARILKLRRAFVKSSLRDPVQSHSRGTRFLRK